jgi:Uma2 family endonuclease
MSTITTTRTPAGDSVTPGEQRIVLRDLDWETYDRLSNAIGEGQQVYVAYDGKDLEITTTSMIHDDFKDMIGRLVNAVTFELNIPCKGTAQVTWKRPEVQRGLEADHSYYLQAHKLEMAARARKRQSNDIADYPNPDLAIEIDISPSRIDRPIIYAALEIPEVWRFDGNALTIDLLRPDRAYTTSPASRFLPITAAEVTRWLLEEIEDANAWERQLRGWIRAVLLPRANDPSAGHQAVG